jgi:hypothetical protein
MHEQMYGHLLTHPATSYAILKTEFSWRAWQFKFSSLLVKTVRDHYAETMNEQVV